MDPTPLIERVLEDEGIASGLEERETTLLIEALTKKVQEIAAGTNDASSARQHVEALCRNARRLARVVESFRDVGESEAKAQAKQFGLLWPTGVKDSESLLQALLKQTIG